MPTPKAVTKTVYNKNGCHVEFTDECDTTQYYIHELTRAALRDVGKFVCKKFMEAYDSHFPKVTGNARKSIKCKVFSSKSTISPRVEIGIKGGKGFYSLFQECGSSKTPRYGLLRHAVEDNVAEIIKIESQYLSGLEGEASALAAQINESDMEGDAGNA